MINAHEFMILLCFLFSAFTTQCITNKQKITSQKNPDPDTKFSSSSEKSSLDELTNKYSGDLVISKKRGM